MTNEQLRCRMESIVFAAHEAIYLVSFIERKRRSVWAAHPVRVYVMISAKLAGKCCKIHLGVFDALCEMPMVDLARLVNAKIAQKERTLREQSS